MFKELISSRETTVAVSVLRKALFQEPVNFPNTGSADVGNFYKIFSPAILLIYIKKYPWIQERYKKWLY